MTLVPKSIDSGDEHPPSAKGLIAVDFDATLFPWGDVHGDKPPLPGAIRFMKGLKKAGWTIVIFTSRMSPSWWKAEGWEPVMAERVMRASVESRLEEHGIPYDYITAEKVPCEYYIDDRAIVFEDNWDEIHRRILGV
jgi:hypothetical protein